MIDLHGTITYRDGRSEAVEAHQAEFAAWERHSLRMGYPALDPATPTVIGLTMTRYLGYAAAHAGTPEHEWPAFDEWQAGVVDVTLEGDEAGAETPPTPPVASVAWSQR